MIYKKYLNFKYPTGKTNERQKTQKNQTKETEVFEAVKTYL